MATTLLCPGTPCGRCWTRQTHAEPNSAHNGLTACRMSLQIFSAASGNKSPSPLRKSARTLCLPATTGPRFALHGRQRESYGSTRGSQPHGLHRNYRCRPGRAKRGPVVCGRHRVRADFRSGEGVCFPEPAEKICKDIRHAVKPLWAELGSACVCRVQHRPQGVPGHNKLVAIARVLSAAGAPDRYHER